MKKLFIVMMIVPTLCMADYDDEYQVKVSYMAPEAPPIGTKIDTDQEKQFFKEKGYYFNNISTDPKKLYSLGHSARAMATSQSFLGSTPITKTIPQLAFPFKGLSMIKPENVIGYEVAPVRNDKGFTVITEYFNDPDLGTCSLILDYVYKTGGTITYNAATVEYYVNNKPGNQSAEGSDETGYSYDLEWTDSKFHYDFKCATTKFDKNLLNQQISLARLIDNEASKF